MAIPRLAQIPLGVRQNTEPAFRSASFGERRIAGMMGGLGFDIQSKTSLDVMTEDVIRSNEIEGILLNADRVRSSVARHLGIPTEGLPEPDHYTEACSSGND